MRPEVVAVFQVTTLQGYSFVKQLYPVPRESIRTPIVRVPDMSSLYFVITFTTTASDGEGGGGSDGKLEILFSEHLKEDGLKVPYSQYTESLGETCATLPGHAIAYATMPSSFPPRSDAANADGQRIVLRLYDREQSTCFFELDLPFRQVRLSGKIFAEAVGEFGVLIDLETTPFTWIPFANSGDDDDDGDDGDDDGNGGNNDGGCGGDKNGDSVGGSSAVNVDEARGQSESGLQSGLIERPKSAGPESTDFDDIEPLVESEQFSELVGEPIDVVVSSEDEADAHHKEAADPSNDVDEIVFAEDELNASYSSSPNEADPAADPARSDSQQQQVASLMQQVGSLLIGSRVGQMVVTAGASAVAVSEFDASRIRSRYTCSPIYMLGVEYRMLGPETNTGRTVYVQSPISYSHQPPSASCSSRSAAAIESVVVVKNSYCTVVSRHPDPRLQAVARQVIAMPAGGAEKLAVAVSDFLAFLSSFQPSSSSEERSGKGSSISSSGGGGGGGGVGSSKWTLQSKINKGSSSKYWKLENRRERGTCECRLDNVMHTDLEELVICDITVGFGSTSPQHNASMALTLLADMFRFILHDGHQQYRHYFVTRELLNVQQQPVGPSFPTVPMAVTGQVIPHGKKIMNLFYKEWRRLGGQVYVWQTDDGWLVFDLSFAPSTLHLSSPFYPKHERELVLDRYRLARSGDGSFRLALIDAGGRRHILRAFNREEYSLLLRMLDIECLPDTAAGGKDDLLDSASAGSSDAKEINEWMEQNSGILGEFLYDFQSRFWFTYRRAFERIGGSSTLLSTDAGWGCMLRTGQSMLAEAMARVLLGREWRLHELKENPDALNGYVSIISRFLDNSKAPLSVHQMAVCGSQSGLAIGEWFGPTVLARVIKKLVNTNAQFRIRVSIRFDGVFPLGKLQMTMQSHPDQPLLLLFPLRLGIDKINPIYYPLIKGALKSALSVGIVGGRPNRSLYFVGHQDDDLFYLDPHCVRPALASVRDALGTLELHGDTVRACPIADLDPSMLLGFLCADGDELFELRAQLEGLHSGCPLFSFV